MIDHTGFGMMEGIDTYPEYHESAFNIGEAEIVTEVYDYLVNEMGLEKAEIGVICPHWAQVAYCKYMLEERNMDFS